MAVQLDLPCKLILGSASPRRKALLARAGYMFEVRVSDADETIPAHIGAFEVAEYLSHVKASVLKADLHPTDELLITVDTVVILNQEVINKPTDEQQAIDMLRRLSGKQHLVMSGVTLLGNGRQHTFRESTQVYFNPLTLKDIIQYVETEKPFDKAGAYGIQDWIGLIGVSRIEGDFYNVMGLPVQELNKQLHTFVAKVWT
jgi:septum formation protein